MLGEFLDEPTLAQHRARADAAAERGEQYDAVYRIRGDDGRIRWVRHHSVVLPDAPHTRIGFWLDVTENRYHDMVEGLPAIVAVPRVVAPSMNVTVPVAVAGVTKAWKVIGAPATNSVGL